jgi:DNA-binding beta-propeller fold protein YncE
MAARERHRLALALLAAAALAGLAGGCGTKFILPTEIRAKSNPGQGTYQRIATWEGMTNIQDILLTSGGELFMVFQDQVARTGEVHQFSQANKVPLSTTFPGLLNPTAICVGGNRIFVLDQGDTTFARTTLTGSDSCFYTAEYNADVNPVLVTLPFRRPITNVASYWHVREYGLGGGTSVSGFTDTSFAWVSGVAADALGRVYVGGVIMYCRVDPYNDHLRTLELRYRIRRYVPGTGDRFVIGGPWRRDPTYVLLDGTGYGSAKDPRGMQWAEPQGPALYFADLGNNQVQRYGDPAGGAPSFKLDFGGSGADSMLLSGPMDVAVDSAGYVYVMDAGNLRVLRYDSDGRFVQRVDRTPDDDKPPVVPPLVGPVAVAADNRQVYIANRGAAQVLRYRRRD